MTRCFIQCLPYIILLGLALPVQAGSLWLTNGDIISGEPVELAGGELQWKSDSAGLLTTSQLNIRFIQSDREVLLQIGQEKLLDACRFEVDDGKPLAPLTPVKADAVAAENGEIAESLVNTAAGQQSEESQSEAAAASGTGQQTAASAAETPVAGADASQPAEPESQPQQWIMCKNEGFPLTSWKQVSRFFEFKPPEPDKWKASGKVVLYIDDESGNTNERTTNVDIVAEFRYRKRRHILTIENDLESTSGTDTKDERKVSYQFDRFLTDRWFWAGTGSWEQNKFQDLTSKWVIASGPGYQFYETKLLTLSFQGGLAYVDEKFDDADERSYPAVRTATNFSWLLHENGLKFIHTNLFYQSLQRTENWVIETDTGITMPLLGSFKVELLFEYDYDNYPSSSAVKEDRIWKVGFSYVW